MDFSTMKNFPITTISETFKVQFRAEMFNITNHGNFVPGQPDSGDGGSGLFNSDGTTVNKSTTCQPRLRILGKSSSPLR